MNSPVVLLLVLLVICIPCTAEETKYPPVLQRLQERYEPLRLQQKKQLDAVKKIATEMEGFNAKLEARKPRDVAPLAKNVDTKASVGAELDGYNSDNKSPAGSDDGSLFNLSPIPSVGGMGGMGGYGEQVPIGANQNVSWAGYEELTKSHWAQKYAFAQIVAEKLSREDLEQIVEYPWSEHLQKIEASEAAGFFEFSSAVATEIALRETSNQKLREVIATKRVSPGLGPFLIDLYHDERSFKLLSGMATAERDSHLGAHGLMLGYDPPADFRAKLEAKKSSKQSLTDHEKRLIASWNYADSLLPQDKPKYLDFERRFHAAFCISPPDHNHVPSHFLHRGASFFRWKDGDDRFLLHEAENAANDHYSYELIRKLEIFLNPEQQAQLKVIRKP